MPKAKDGGIVNCGICSRSSLTIPHRLSAEPPLHKGALGACKIRSKSRQECAQAADSHRRLRRYKSPQGNSVLRRAVSSTEHCSTSRRDRAALSTSMVENVAQAADHRWHPRRDKAAEIIALLSLSHPRRDKSPRGMAFTHSLDTALSYTFFSPLRAAIDGAWLRNASSTRRYKSPCAFGFLGPRWALSRQGGDGGVGGLRGARSKRPPRPLTSPRAIKLHRVAYWTTIQKGCCT